MNVSVAPITSFKCYRMFHRLRLHFAVAGFDYYAPDDLKITLDGYKSKPAHVRNWFVTMAAKFRRHEQVEHFLLAHLIDARRDVWIGDLAGPESDYLYQQWKSRSQSLRYRLQQEFGRLVDRNGFDNLFRSEPGQHPVILMERLRWRAGNNESLSPETFALMNAVLDFFPLLDQNLCDDFMWIRMRNLAAKYLPFLVSLVNMEQLKRDVTERSTRW
jgi:hypothetical protein